MILCTGIAAAGEEAPAGEPETSELDLFQLDAVVNAKVVTASGGTEEDRTLSSANVYVVTDEEIAAHGWRTLGEVLANVPGLYVIDDNVLPSLGVRGVTGGLNAGTRIVKVMVNSTPVSFRPLLSAFLGPELIPMDLVERIEIAKGPLSALYGANAFLATVNVITRRPSQGVGGSAELNGLLVGKSFGGGAAGVLSYGGERASLLMGVSTQHLDRSGFVQAMTFSGQSSSPLFGRESQHDISQPLSAFLRLTAGAARVGQFSLDAGLQRLDGIGDFQLNSILTERTRVVLYNLWSNARYEKQWRRIKASAALGYSSGNPERDYQLYLTGTNAHSFHPNYDYWAINAIADVEYTPFKKAQLLSVKLGLDVEFDRERILYYTETFNQPEGTRQPGDTLDLIGADTPRHQEMRDVGVFLNAQSAPLLRLPDLHLTANLRVDTIAFGAQSFPVQLSWRAAIAYRWSAIFSTKLIAGSAFQTPSGVLLYGLPGFGNANNVVGNNTVSGLVPLRPQAVTSVEIMGSANLFGHLAVEAGAFFQDLTDKIEFVQTGTDFVAANRGERRALGLEASLRFSYRWFSAYGNVSLQDSVTNGSFDASTPLYPNIWGLIGARAIWQRGHIAGNAQVRVVGPRGASDSNAYINNGQPYTLPTYADLDVTLRSVGLHAFGDGETRVLVSARNLIGEIHAEPGFAGFDLPSRPRTFFFELRQAF